MTLALPDALRLDDEDRLSGLGLHAEVDERPTPGLDLLAEPEVYPGVLRFASLHELCLPRQLLFGQLLGVEKQHRDVVALCEGVYDNRFDRVEIGEVIPDVEALFGAVAKLQDTDYHQLFDLGRVVPDDRPDHVR